MLKTEKKKNIHSTKKEDSKYIPQIIEIYQNKLEYMLDNHSRVIQKRFDLHYPENNSREPNNKDIYRFTNNYLRDLNRNNPLPQPGKIRSSGRPEQEFVHPMDVQFMTVREQTSEDKNPHYHCLVLANGQARRDGYYFQKKAEHHWNNILGLSDNSGLVNNPNQTKSDFIVLDKYKNNFESKKEEAFNQAKYLAKNKSKEFNPKGTWKVTGNRIPKN
jgi:hypothetical protein